MSTTDRPTDQTSVIFRPGTPRRRGRRITKVAGALGVGCLVAGAIGAGVLFWRSPGTPRPHLDEAGTPIPGSVAEKTSVRINGVDQGMFISGEDSTNPVLLFVHGGPGMPEHFLEDTYPTGLDKDFTVVWWEQRGAGLSSSSEITAESMTVEQFVQDTLAVTEHLRARFGVDKIYLMGHSWGTLVGIQAVAQAPELFHAYVAVAQITDQTESEALSYAYLLEHYRDEGDSRLVSALEAAPVTAGKRPPAAYEKIRDDAMHRAGVGTTREMESVVSGIFAASWMSPIYTLGEKVDLWFGKASSLHDPLVTEMYATDLRRTVTKLAVPVYFLHGAHDQTVSAVLAREYLADLDAPVKGFYTFEQSAHSPVFEEPDLVRTVLREDVLAGVDHLADRD